MTKIFLLVYPLAHLSLALMEWVLIIWAISLWRQSTSLAMILLLIVLASINYDNLVLSAGNLTGEGDFLKLLNMLRFLFHYLVVPLFIVIAVELAHHSGAAWTNPIVRVLSWVLSLGLGGFEVATQFIGLELVPVTFAGILRYTVAEVNDPPIVTILISLFVLLVGIGIWIRLDWKWPWLFVGTLVALIGNAIPASLVGTLAGSTSDFVIALSLLLTERRIQCGDNRLESDSSSPAGLSSKKLENHYL